MMDILPMSFPELLLWLLPMDYPELFRWLGMA